MPALQFYFLGGVGGVLSDLFDSAKDAFQYPQVGAADTEGAEGEVSWHQLAGKRLHRCLAMLKDPWKQFLMAALSVVLEPLRALHSRYMALGCSALQADQPPGLFDELMDERSLTTAALQHYAELLSKAGGRLRLVWGRDGFATATDWRAARPQEAAMVRQLVLAAAAWVEKRHRLPFRRWPFRLLGLGDARRSDRETLAADFMRTPTCVCVSVREGARERDNDRALWSSSRPASLHWCDANFGSVPLLVADAGRAPRSPTFPLRCS